MRQLEITIKMPEAMYDATRRLALESDISVGQFVRHAVSDEIKRCTRNAKTPNRADERLLAPLRALLAADFGLSKSWEELQSRLNRKGYILREAGGGLALHSYPEGDRLCKASELGHAYRALMQQFGQPFPGHSHRHLVKRVLKREQPDDVDTFDLIEPF